MIEVIAYTDGSSNAIDRSGGWAAVLLYKGVVKEISGHASDTTNNRMELTAVLKAVEAMKVPCQLTIYTDSNDVIGWLNGTFEARNKAIAHLCLEIQAAAALKEIQVKLLKVDGHSNDYYNDRADLLASMAKHSVLEQVKEGAG